MTENFAPQDEQPQDEQPQDEQISIDDALETDRVVEEGPDSRNADGYGFDADLDRGGDDATAAEQGNRDEDRMRGEGDDVDQLEHIVDAAPEAPEGEDDLPEPEDAL
ncbi:hypothetical protein ACT3SP_01600 [Brachybacterium sp. AOP43-C2-M15]|uniref:hypothetical protein n=1 Tax=Brachybacterium sp. AOP43-C2-M15 TaxID=3457661 RepID=UPI004033CD87